MMPKLPWKLRWQMRLRAWWHRVMTWLVLQHNKLRTMGRVRQIPHLREPAAAAMKKVYLACPYLAPDCLSAGIQNGGDALFFRHKDATEVFIGKNYDHAADELIAWLKRQADGIETATRSAMSRQERRAHSASFRREARRQRKRRA